MKVVMMLSKVCFYTWLIAVWLLSPMGTAPSSANPYEVRCQEPLPPFTLGEKSNPTKAQEAALYACIWENLGSWERKTSAKLATGKESEISRLYMLAYPARFGKAVEKCGGKKL